MAVSFDTLKPVACRRTAGFSADQAENVWEALGKIATLRHELNGEMAARREENRGTNNPTRWMFGAVLTANIAIVIRLFFG